MAGEEMRLVPVTFREAKAFVREHHRHSAPQKGHRFSVGLAEGEELIGVATVGRPIARLLDTDGTAEVTRCCVRPGAPKGSCSKLYAACWRAWRAMGGTRLITYTLQTETGASLRGAGWKIVGEVSRGGQWNRASRPRQQAEIYDMPKYRWAKEESE